jgi:protein-S-isoprenylcysteine O-methyltransferase Ste14
MRFLELRVPPPLVMLTAGALMWLAARATPGLSVQYPARWVVLIAFAALGMGIAFTGIVQFQRAKTTIHPMNPGETSALVTSGIYARTRNPMYLGLALVLCGWAAFLGNLVAVAGIPVFMLYIARFQIAPEERVLAEKFRTEFAAYRARVGRWI